MPTLRTTGRSRASGILNRPVIIRIRNRKMAPSERRVKTNHNGGINCTAIFITGQLMPQNRIRSERTTYALRIVKGRE
jgi:hypothetical protein